jgi:hypothetical protein
MEDICPQTSKTREFKLMPHQEFLKNFISPNTPYNGVLIYHSTGVGKTCTAISIAEGFKDTMKSYNKKIIVISSDAIKKNFKKELYNPAKERTKKKKDDIVQCTGLTYELGDEFKYLTQEQKLLKIDKIISESYQFYAYQKFANVLMKNIGIDEDNLNNLTDDQKKKIHQIYSNRVIIVDEVHNIRKGSSNLKFKKIFKMLEIIIENTVNLKLVLMSATPMYDKPKEIVDLLNLLLANDNRNKIKELDIFDRQGNFVPEGKERLLTISKGYVSYLRGENPSTFPLRIVPKEAVTPELKYDIMGDEIPDNERMKYEKLILCDLRGLQYEVYHEHLNKRLEKIHEKQEKEKKKLEKEQINNNKKKINSKEVNNKNGKNDKEVKNDVPVKEKKESITNVLGPSITQIGNIVFPTDTGGGTFGAGGFDDNGSGAFEKTVQTQLGKKFTQYKYRQHAIIGLGTKQEKPFLDLSVLENYSCKFKRAFDFIKNSKGTVLISSLYISAGVLPFALMLEQNGFQRYTIEGEQQLLDARPYKKRESICYRCGEVFMKDQHTNKKNKDYHTFKNAKYVIVTGKSDNDFRIDTTQATRKFSSQDNKYGEQIKVFLGTDVIKEGLDFSNIRQMYLMDPWYNNSAHEQKIGRAIRFCSHVFLKPKERNVEIFKMVTSNRDAKDKKTRETETSDERRYRIAENKDYKIKEARNILKRGAIDCVPYKKRNIYSDKKKVKQVTSRGQVIEVSKDDKPYSVECDYQKNCNFDCVWEPKGKIKIDTDTYDLIFDRTDIDKIKKRINKLFKTDIVFEISQIKDYIMKEYPDMEERFIYKALEELIDNGESLYDRFHRKGKLIYSGDYYIFEPSELTGLKLPVLYREKPLKKKPKKMKLIDFKLSITNNQISNHANGTKKSKNNMVKNTTVLNEHLVKIITSFENYNYIKKMDSSKGGISYDKAVAGTFLDKFDVKLYIEFVKYILEYFIKDDKTNKFLVKNNDIVKIIVAYLDDILIKNGRDIEEKSLKKNEIYGFRLNDEYYHFNVKKDRWEGCKTYIIRQVENYRKTVKKTIEDKDKTREKNNIIGILSKNKKNTIVFQLIDFDKYKFAKTQKDKKSKRSELSGQVCKTIDTVILTDVREKLKLKEVKIKKTRLYICNEIEILLRIYSYNNKDNKVWLINKNL